MKHLPDIISILSLAFICACICYPLIVEIYKKESRQ